MMKTTKNTKELYITEIPSDWVVKKLGEISVIKTGDKDTQNKVEDGLYPFFVRSDNVERINSFSYDGEAILTSGDGVGVGNNFHYIIGKFDFHQRVYSIRKFNSETFGKFIYYYFSEKFYERVIKLSAKNSVDSVRMEMIFDMKIPLPPLPEQIAIAQVLSTADAAIHTSEKLIAQKELRKKWLMQQLLTGKKRLKGYNGDWKEMQLGDFIIESRIPSINNDVNRRITVKLNLKGIEKRDVRGSEAEDATYYFIRKKNQFIYGKQNLHKGAFGIIPDELDGFESSQDIPTFDFQNGVSPIYFMFFMSQEGFYQSLEKISTGTGSKRIHPENLYKVKVKFPSLEEQTAIAHVLEAAEKEISLLKAKVEKLREQKKGLMQVLLTGKVRLNNIKKY